VATASALTRVENCEPLPASLRALDPTGKGPGPVKAEPGFLTSPNKTEKARHVDGVPNWCGNRLTVTGDPDDLRSFVDVSVGEDKEGSPVVRFEGAAPEPDGLDGDAAYRWRLGNWGTKWTDAELYYDDTGEADVAAGEIELQFSTAWSPPGAWVGAAAARWPGLRFDLRWSEPSMSAYGRVVGEHGVAYDDDGVPDDPAAAAVWLEDAGFTSDSISLRGWAVSSGSFPDDDTLMEWVADAADDDDFGGVLDAISSSGTVPVGVLAQMAEHPDPQVREAAAMNPRTPSNQRAFAGLTSGLGLPAAPQPGPLCGAAMPVARARCALGAGHAGSHRSTR